TREKIGQTFSNLGQVNSIALLLIFPLQMLNYHSYTSMYRGLFKILDLSVPYRAMYRIALEINFVNNVFPSGGLSTFSYIGTRMKPLGITGSASTVIQMMRFVLIFLSFQILLFIGLFLMALNGRANGVMILITGSIASFLFAATGIFAFVIGSERRIQSFFMPLVKLINRLFHTIKRSQPQVINIERAKTVFSNLHHNYVVIRKNYRQLKKPFIYSFFANLTEILTLYSVYVAFDQLVNPGAVIIGYAIANFAGLVAPHLPGGIGVYEALMTGVMAAGGVPAAITLPATVMYRVLTQLLQLPIGYFFYSKFMRTKYGRKVQAARE
ncbi:MAG TPA: lysylphosphatidylglycerol synthase transmembrane domain-containing protein, partial [Candidatus Saccharimonadales bacterium]|nr:lysylphosphatidylglycerol synthase transmembrane domain-containing protein [Candidatus Saccharimonadales bacterium]